MMLGVEELVVAERHEDAFPGVELGEGELLEALALELEDDTVHVAGGRDDLAADRVAGFEEVALGEVAVVAPRPDLSAALHRDELSRHPQTSVAAAHRPLEDVAGSELPSGLACIHGPRAVALGGGAGSTTVWLVVVTPSMMSLPRLAAKSSRSASRVAARKGSTAITGRRQPERDAELHGPLLLGSVASVVAAAAGAGSWVGALIAPPASRCSDRSSSRSRAAVRSRLADCFHEALLQQSIECRWQAGTQLRDRGRLVAHDGEQDRGQAVAVERAPPGRELVEHDAEREDVASLVDRLAIGLLGRHVARRADQATEGGDLGQGLVASRGRAGGELGEAEVEYFETAVGGEHDVGGLEVAVHDAARVGGRHASASATVVSKKVARSTWPSARTATSERPSTNSMVRK